MALEIKCPDCGEVGKVSKNGSRWSGRHRLQMFRCGACGYVFSEKRLTQALIATKTGAKRGPVKATPGISPIPATPSPLPITGVCPFCGGELMRAGMDKNDPDHPVQRYTCKACHKRTKNPKPKEVE